VHHQHLSFFIFIPSSYTHKKIQTYPEKKPDK